MSDSEERRCIIGISGVHGIGGINGHKFLRFIYDGVKKAEDRGIIRKTCFTEFSEPIKQILRMWYGFDQKFLSKEINSTRRHKYRYGVMSLDFVQRSMTFYRNLISEDVFIKMMEWQTAKFKNVIFIDVHYANEASFVRCIGGKMIHFRDRRKSFLQGHESERLLKPVPGDIIYTYDKGNYAKDEKNLVLN